MHRKIIMALVAVAATFVMTVPAGAATNPVVFNSVPDQLPPNVPSYGAEAYYFVRLGDAVRFAPGKRVLKNVKVVMSDWACETGDWFDGTCITTPGAKFALAVTFNIYALDADGSVGSFLATKTQTFNFKFRPSSDPTNCPANTTAWYSTVTGKCYNGLAQKITFGFASQNVRSPLPNQVVYGIEYNTTRRSEPVRRFGPGGLPEHRRSRGSPDARAGPEPERLLHRGASRWHRGRQRSLHPATAATPNVFSLDDGCQTGFNPLVRFLVKK